MSDDSKHKNLYWYILAGLLGFILMSYELFITRMVAPTVGLSVYTWTAAIGWVLLGMSIGSFFGGKLTEKYPAKQLVSITGSLVFASMALILGFLGARYGLLLVSENMVFSVLVLTFIVSLPFAITISIIPPQIASLVITNQQTAGKNYSYLSLFHALGSILGVFLTGFFFFEILPLSYSIACLSIFLVITAAFIIFTNTNLKNLRNIVVIFLAAIIVIWILLLHTKTCVTQASGIFCTDTQYYTARVIDAPFQATQGRVLFLDADAHSIESKESTLSLYTLFTYLPKVLVENPKQIAVLGAGAYVAPVMLARQHPAVTIDVVDIDSALEAIAKRFFFSDFPKNILSITTDARWYIANTKQKYDVIIGDVYNSLIAVPFHLTTVQYMESVKNALTENGIYIFAFISEQNKNKSDLAKSFYQTAKQTFPSVQVFALEINTDAVQNIVIVASKSKLPDSETLKQLLASNKNLSPLTGFIIANPDEVFTCGKDCILTDDFSPTEKLISPVRQQYFSGLIRYLRLVF